jgi:serine/threonine protein kinase
MLNCLAAAQGGFASAKGKPMPSPTTNEEFLELVRKSGVVDEKRLTTYLEKSRASQSLPPDPAKLAGLLVRDGLLTHFQAEQFLQGKWRRFTIGKYKVLERLGAGGMGSVYLCEHKLMRRRVAVKVLPTAKAEDTSSLERFYREARAVAALDHPNIVRAYDIDQDDKLHFLVMEHVDGSSLQDIVKKTGPMDVLRACHYIRQAALGLQHAHETAGIVHRDIKPGNILVDRNGIVKILDMGLARFFHDEDDILTRKFEENVLGTADYLAPEQALDSHSVDIRADIYSLGATFYYCLSGRTPFAEGTVAQKLIWHQTRQPKPLRQLRPEIAEEVVAIIDRMMAKDPGQRYPAPIAVADALAPWTQTPIPPPPDNEMPQLSPAAMGGGPSSDNPQSGGPRTPPSSGELSPRKTWQVSQGATPAPLPAPPPSNPPAASSPPRDLRKTNPPPGGPIGLHAPMQAPPPTVAPAVSPARRGSATAPVAPQVRATPPLASPPARTPTPTAPIAAPAGRSRPSNGTTHVAAPVLPPPAPAAADAALGNSWEELANGNGASPARSGTVPRAARKGPASSTMRVGGLPPAITTNAIGWVIGIASLIVLAIVGIGIALAFILGGKSDSGQSMIPGSAVYYVNRLGTNGASSSISAVLEKIRQQKGKYPVRIVVQEDLAESDVLVDVSNVTIEADPGKTIRWRPSSKANSIKLLQVSKAESFLLKGFELDGEYKIEFLINLYLHCPGCRIEDVKLQGFKKYGIWIANCEGGESPDRHVVFRRLTFVTTQKEQASLFLSIESGARDFIPKNKFLDLRDCTFDGPGDKVRTPDPSTLDHVDLPAGVQPVQGR